LNRATSTWKSRGSRGGASRKAVANSGSKPVKKKKGREVPQRIDAVVWETRSEEQKTRGDWGGGDLKEGSENWGKGDLGGKAPLASVLKQKKGFQGKTPGGGKTIGANNMSIDGAPGSYRKEKYKRPAVNPWNTWGNWIRIRRHGEGTSMLLSEKNDKNCHGTMQGPLQTKKGMCHSTTKGCSF